MTDYLRSLRARPRLEATNRHARQIQTSRCDRAARLLPIDDLWIAVGLSADCRSPISIESRRAWRQFLKAKVIR